MRKFQFLLFIALFPTLISCGGSSGSDGPRYKLEPILEELAYPIRVSQLPSGSLVYAELLTGYIYEYDQANSKKNVLATFPPATNELAGISGLLVDDNFQNNHFLFVYYYNPEKRRNVVSRVTVGPIVKKEDIFTAEQASGHNGGGMVQDENGIIYLGIGDGDSSEQVNSLATKLGKIVAFNRNGISMTANSIIAQGLRNPFGLTQLAGNIFIADNGPECDDEVNLLKLGQDFGWGLNYSCGDASTSLAGSIFSWSKSEGLTDLLGIQSSKISDFNNSLILSRFTSNTIVVLKLKNQGTEIESEKAIFTNSDHGPFIDFHQNDLGEIIVTTPNSILKIVE